MPKPPGQRRKSREAAFLAAFSQSFTRDDAASSLRRLSLIEATPREPLADEEKDWKVPPWDEFAMQLAGAVDAHRAEIDGLIQERLKDWTLERLSPSVLALLRLGVAELRFMEGVPPKVAINEYVELAKRFAEAEAPSLVNAVLDRIHKTSDK